jgi:hypothetical protein
MTGETINVLGSYGIPTLRAQYHCVRRARKAEAKEWALGGDPALRSRSDHLEKIISLRGPPADVTGVALVDEICSVHASPFSLDAMLLTVPRRRISVR